MKATPENDKRVVKMVFASVYILYYITKVESKCRTKKELYLVIKWLPA